MLQKGAAVDYDWHMSGTRRDLLKMAPLAMAATQAEAQGTHPNIVLIISDQFRADNLGCMGANPMNMTPTLDALAKRGVLFRGAMATNPVCAPARGTMFTGQYPEKHGVWHNGFGLKPDAVTLAGTLRQAGYTANYIGKWHLGANEAAVGGAGPVAPESRGGFLDFWEAANAIELTSHPYEGDIYDGDGKAIHFSGVYRTDFLTQRAVRFLKEKRTQAPFLLTVSYLETHHQNDIDKFVPPKKFENSFRNPFVPQDLRPLPGSWPSQLADYYGCVAGIDDAVKTLLDTLHEQGIEKNTIVVFTSDHGCHFKTRNAEYKRSPHESSIHIPLIVAGPGFGPGVEVPELVSQVDLAPSLLQAVGIATPGTMQGRSFLPLLKRNTDGWRNEVYIQTSEFITGRVLRTPQWTYAAAVPKRQGVRPEQASERYVEYMLYDNYADPFQHVNLAGHTETQAVSRELRTRLIGRIAEAGGPKCTIDPPYFPYS
jgi:arylsulfatase A-like enzyme